MEVMPKPSPLELMAADLAACKKRKRSCSAIGLRDLAAQPAHCDHAGEAGAMNIQQQDEDDAEEEETAALVECQVNDQLRGCCSVGHKSLTELSLQLRWKMILIETWACDLNCLVMERKLFAIAKELAILTDLGVYEELTCTKFLTMALSRMNELLANANRRESLKMSAEQMWAIAKVQAKGHAFKPSSYQPAFNGASSSCSAAPSSSPLCDGTSVDEFPLLSAFDSSSKDLSGLWKAMSLAKSRGAQLWHENKPEQALPFLLAADSYMKRFTLKYQRLKIDHAMVDSLLCHTDSELNSYSNSNSNRRCAQGVHRVSFNDEPQVLGVADSDVDRSPICPTRVSKLESLLLRTSREFPAPAF